MGWRVAQRGPLKSGHVDRTGNQHVPNEDKAQRGSSGLSLLDQVLEVCLRDVGHLLVRVGVLRAELVVRRNLGHVLSWTAVAPMGAAVVHDRRQSGETVHRNARDLAFQEP
jgi:hypothetical protein